MTAPRLPRRLVVGLTSAALVGGVVGFVPLLGSASADACPTWSDPAGDSGVSTPAGSDPTGLSADDDLDVVQSTATFDATGGLVASVKVAKLADGPANTPGDEFILQFNAAGTSIKATMKRDVLEGTEGATLAGAASATGKVKFDLPTSTVTGTFTADQVKTAFGKPAAGVKLDTFVTLAYGYSESPAGPGLGFPLTDESDAPTALTYTDAGGCGGSSTPGPTGTGTPSPTPTPTPTPTTVPVGTLFDQPRKNCVQYKDATGDADPSGTGLDNEDALDINQVNLKSPAGQLQVFVGIVDPSTSLFPLFSGPVYSTSFTVNGKAVALSAGADGPATATVATVANTDIKATLKIDATHKNVVFTVPLDGLSKAVGATVAKGTAITLPAAGTAADSPLGALDADSAAGTTAPEKTYAYGDNTCFLPPPGVITLDTDPSGQYSDVTELFATLNDADGSPVQGEKVTAVLTGGRPVTVKTDNDGIADIKLPLLVAAGAKTITVTYAGSGEVGPAKATKGFTVTAEKTLLKLVASRGGATATVLDNDKHPVVGRYVTFVVGSAKRVVKTNAKGVAVLTGVKKGTAVKATFLAVKGYYLGTPTYTVRAL